MSRVGRRIWPARFSFSRHRPTRWSFTGNHALRNLLKIFGSAFATGFSGAVVPGPLLLVCAHQTLTSGFAAGMATIVGHAAMEFVLVIAMLAGLARFLKTRPLAFQVVKVGAGIVLMALGVTIIISAPSASFQLTAATEKATVQPLLMGAAVSIGNPYFILWWATVGLALLGSAARSGRAAVPVFYVGHILSDFAWFAFIAGSLALGRRAVLGETSYRLLLEASGVFMIAFGTYFAIRRGAKQHAPLR